jgi:hypothetical protein
VKATIGFIASGFEFFGDRPEWIRNEENLKSQRDFFEFQLALAIDAGLPLLVHMRKATDVLLGYAPRLRQLPSLIFHGWPGRIHDANAFLLKGVNAFFSFGTPLLRQAARPEFAALPRDPFGTDAPCSPPSWSWTSTNTSSQLPLIASAPDRTENGLLLIKNFNKAFGLVIEWSTATFRIGQPSPGTRMKTGTASVACTASGVGPFAMDLARSCRSSIDDSDRVER